MGTTLTGTTPQDTYDSLIKVTDNGPLSATAKFLSDGLGNDSALALSTTAVGIGTNILFGKFNLADASNARLEATPVADGISFEVLDSARINPLDFKIFANDIIFNTKSGGSYSERMRIDPAGNVGIGTTPSAWDSDFRALQIGLGTTIYNNTTVNGAFVGSNYFYNGSNNVYKNTGSATAYGQINGTHQFFTAPSGTAAAAVTFTERVRIDSDGLKFNGDTAAANALDDYEEGTFTATIAPATSGTITPNATFTTWTYTKIGRQVTINGVFVISSVASPVGASVTVGGLPFTIFNNNGAFGAFSVSYITALGGFITSVLHGRHGTNTTTLDIGKDASTVAASDEIYVTATYFV